MNSSLLKGLGVGIGLIVSYILKDAHFLSLHFQWQQSSPIYPDLLIIFIVFFSLNHSTVASIWLGFFAGLLEDGANYILLENRDVSFISGIHSLVYCLIAFSVSKAQNIINRKSLLSIMAIVLICTLLGRSAIWMIQGIFSNFNKNYTIFSSAIYTSFISPLYFVILHWLYREKKVGKK